MQKMLERLIKKGNHTKDDVSLYKSAAITMGIKVFAIGAGFLLNWVFAKYLGKAGVGKFFLVFGMVTILAMVGKLGLDRTVLRFVATYVSQNEWGKVKGVQFFAFRLVSVVTLSLSVILFFFSKQIAVYWFKQPDLENLIKIFVLGIAPLAIIQNTSETIKGAGKVQLAQSLYDALLPALAILIFLCWPQKNTDTSVKAYLTGVVLVFIITQAAWRWIISRHNVPREKADKEMLLKSAMPIFWSNVFQQINLWMPTFMLGMWAGPGDVGLFEVARRLAALTAIFQAVFNSNLAPRIASLYAKGETKKIQEMCGNSTMFVGMLATPVFLAFILFPAFFTGLFGSEFSEAAPMLSIMSVGQLYNVLMGPVGISLMMCGREQKTRNSIIIAACCLFIMNFILIPRMGALGAAITSCLVLIIQNTVAAFYLWRELKIVTIPFISKWIK